MRTLLGSRVRWSMVSNAYPAGKSGALVNGEQCLPCGGSQVRWSMVRNAYPAGESQVRWSMVGNVHPAGEAKYAAA